MKITVATCQFPTSSNILKNKKYILNQIKEARYKSADVVHFPEAALSGYAGADLPNYDEYDWDLLHKSVNEVIKAAAKNKIWVILGTAYKFSDKHKPYNSLLVINNEGNVLDRYDKRFCAGDKDGKTGDLCHYTPGNHFATFKINGINCGTLICHDYRYPELYREYKKKGVQLMFHSFHAAGISEDKYKDMQRMVGQDNFKFHKYDTIAAITQEASMIASSSNNYMYISCPNSASQKACWGSFFVRPDGIITGQLKIEETNILLSTIDIKEQFYDSTIAWRSNAMNGVFHSGELVNDDDRESPRVT